MSREDLVRELRVYVGDYVRTEKIPLNQREMQAFVEDLVDEMIGFGPIEPLLKDPTISDILINTHKKCFVERFGKLYTLDGVYKLLHRLGYNDLMPRTTHPDTDPAELEAFKKKCCPSVSPQMGKLWRAFRERRGPWPRCPIQTSSRFTILVLMKASPMP